MVAQGNQRKALYTSRTLYLFALNKRPSLWLSKISLAFLMCGIANVSSAGDLNIDSGINNSLVKQTVDSQELGEIDSDNLIIKPYLAFTYTARDLVANVRAEHNHIRRSLEDEDSTNNYSNFSYRTNYDIVTNLLAINISGRQSYRSISSQSFIVDDFLLNSNNLVKTSSNSASLLFSLPVGDYFGTDASLTYTKSNNKNQQDSDNPNATFFPEVDSESYSGSWSINSGDNLRPFTYALNTSAQHSSRSSLGDYDTRFADLTLGLSVYREWSLTAKATYDANEVGFPDTNANTNNDTDNLREFYSYGLGFTWRPSANRYIELAYNQSQNEGSLFSDEEESNSFVSIDTQWQFTPRTRLSGNYSRRFFGKTGSVALSHSLRNWRSSLRYNEVVNTNSQLATIQETGLLVCANGTTDLSQCSTPDSIDPNDLAPGEFLQPFIQSAFELNDNVTLRKSMTAQTSITRRRTTITISANSSSNEDLESNRVTQNDVARLNLLFQIGPRTKFKIDTSYSENEENLSDQLFESTVKQVNLTLERKLSRRFFASLGFRYLDRDGESNTNVSGLSGIQGPLTDRRLSASIEYKFTNVR